MTSNYNQRKKLRINELIVKKLINDNGNDYHPNTNNNNNFSHNGKRFDHSNGHDNDDDDYEHNNHHRSTNKSTLLKHRIIILVITFLIYTTYHLSRKPMSVVKSKLYVNENSTDNWKPFDGKNGKTILSIMDGIYWGNYALFMFITGYIAERCNMRYYLFIALNLCGLMTIILGLAHPFYIHSIVFFIIVESLNGIMQTTGWPVVVAIVGGWFGGKKKGLIFGIWNLHTSVGNILGLVIAGAFVDYDWSLSFIVPGIICIVMAYITFFFLIPKPSDIGIDLNEIDNDHHNDKKSLEDHKNHVMNEHENEEAIGFLSALLIPGVIEFSICLAFTKSVSYIFLNWLPKFLEENSKMSSSSSAYHSVMFDIGGMIGSIIAGFLADKSDASGLVCILFLTMAIPSLFLFHKFSTISKFLNFSLQFVAGFFINGPYALITTAVSANLAHKVPSKSAMVTVSAIIDGTGSIGAAVGPAITGPLADTFGWSSIFYLSMIFDLISIICLIRVGYQEIQKFRK